MTYEMVDAAMPYLPEDKPRYLMGVGTPEEIVHYVAQGVDMMDCVLPTRAARHGLLFTSEGKISIKNARYAKDEGPLDPKCGCKVCRRYSRAYLRHLYASNELLAQVLNTVHNLAYYLDTMRRVRQAIMTWGVRDFSLWCPATASERPLAATRCSGQSATMRVEPISGCWQTLAARMRSRCWSEVPWKSQASDVPGVASVPGDVRSRELAAPPPRQSLRSGSAGESHTVELCGSE